ncbi:hypothetical protein QYM36_003216 [Artemia franciscana]|uniref:Uncharacterized protein n=1 Tax=Artemia franciscana TaxID=6661 RepID=A0AA88IAD8_ARTSF|nr:hypothetical protein QYM36_003216 [Artemia franciscana]
MHVKKIVIAAKIHVFHPPSADQINKVQGIWFISGKKKHAHLTFDFLNCYCYQLVFCLVDPVKKGWLHKETIVNDNRVTTAFFEQCGCSLVKILVAKSITLRCEKPPIDIREYYDVQKSSIHKKFSAAAKKCMKKESRERGNGSESKDIGTDSNSCNEGGSNQVPVLSNALAGTSSLPQYFWLFCSDSSCLFKFPPSSLGNQSGGASKTYVYPKVIIEQQEVCDKAWACAYYACNIPFAVIKNEYFTETIRAKNPAKKEISDHKVQIKYLVETGNKRHTAQLVADELERAAKVWCLPMTGLASCVIPYFNLLQRHLQEAVLFLPVSKAEERKIYNYLEKRRILAYDPALAAAILLDPLFGVNSLGMFTLPSCLSINSSLPRDSGDGLVEDDLPDIAFEDTLDEKEKDQLQEL